MNMLLIENCCEILDSQRVPITSTNRVKGNYPYYGANGIQDYVADYIFDDELVLLAEDGGNFGSKERPIAYRVSGKCWVNNHAHVLKPKAGLDVDYLCYSLMFYNTDGLVNGATRQKLTQATMKKMQIPERNIEEQKEIVKKLNIAKSIITHRRTQLEKLDLLVKARFVEMFGDPNDTSRDKEKRHKIGELCDVTKLAGFEFTEYINYQDSGEIIMLRGLNCKQGKLILDNVKYIDRETSHKLPRSRLYIGDILMTYAGTIGDVAMVDENDKYHLAPNVAKISIINRKKLSPVFLVHLFMYSHDYIMSFVSQVAQASINMQKIRNFEYAIPSIEEQYEFEKFVQQVDKSRVAVQKELDKAQMLFDSLMQEYFG